MTDQTALPLGAAGGDRVGDGLVVAALRTAVQAACLPAKYGGAVAALELTARALDEADRSRRPQIVAQLIKGYLDGLARLGLVPAPAAPSYGSSEEPQKLSHEEGTSAGLGGYSGPTLVDAPAS